MASALDANVSGKISTFYNEDDYYFGHRPSDIDLKLYLGWLVGDPSILLTTLHNVPVNWISNQQAFKTDLNFNRHFKYSYLKPTKRGFMSAFSSSGSSVSREVKDIHEMQSFVARARSNPVGADSRVAGASGSRIDLAQYGYAHAEEDHIAEFARSVQKTWAFTRIWQARFNVNLVAP